MFFILLSSIYPQENSEYHPTDDLLFKVAVYGPSDEIFIWWGHAALIVENTRWDYSRVFDWGIFTYPSDNFLKEFVSNNVSYKCESGYLHLNSYINEDRDITVYTLNLDRKAKETMLNFAENKVLPENCYYDYHEFRDNCSTSIRDILDIGIDGHLKAAFDNVPGRFSFRQHIQRYTWFRPVSDWFLGFLMGQDLDKQISPWEEMFLPIEIGRNIVDFSYIDNSGVERPLVSSVQIFNTSKSRPPILNEPLVTWPFTLCLGLICGTAILLIYNLREKYPRIVRVVIGLIQGLLGLLFGAAGLVLTFGLFFMSNDYIQQNINILFINPLLFLIVPLGIMVAINRPQQFFNKISPERLLRIIWTCIFIAAGVSALLKALPFFFQQNQTVLSIILPIALSLSFIPEKIIKQ